MPRPPSQASGSIAGTQLVRAAPTRTPQRDADPRRPRERATMTDRPAPDKTPLSPQDWAKAFVEFAERGQKLLAELMERIRKPK